MEKISDQLRLEALLEAGEGLIYNEFENGAGGAAYNLLHWAGCGHLRRANLSYPKRHFLDAKEAMKWLLEHRGAEGAAWRRCSFCAAEPKG